jgi:phosphatidylglycerol lysyltransferase
MKNQRLSRIVLETWLVKIISVLVASAGLVNTISAIFPALHYRIKILHHLFPIQLIHTARVTTAVSGFFLIIIAFSLWRKKRVAWVLAITMLTVAIASNLLKGFDIEEAAYLLFLLIALFYLRPHFKAKSDLPSLISGIYIFIISIFFTLLYGTVGFFYLDKHFKTNFDFVASLSQTIKTIFLVSGTDTVALTGFGRFFENSIPAIAFITVGFGVFKILQPVTAKINNGKETDRAIAIIKKFGNSPLATFAQFPDKTYFIFENSTVIAYRVIGRTALVLGDPIGESKNLQKAVAEFAKLCEHNDWRVAFYQVKEQSIYKKNGFSLLSVGEEACVNLKEFDLIGHNRKKLRNSVNRLKALGFCVEIIEPPLGYWQLEELQSVSDEWLERKNGRENGFSLGYFDDNYIRNSYVGVVRDKSKGVCAFVNIINVNEREIAIDLMRKRLNQENGIMEFLFAELFLWAKKKGYLFCNLGLSPLANVGIENTDPFTEKFLNSIYENVNMFYNFRGLHRFKEKFDPLWSRRYLAYLKSSNLVAIAATVIRAHQGKIYPEKIFPIIDR